MLKRQGKIFVLVDLIVLLNWKNKVITLLRAFLLLFDFKKMSWISLCKRITHLAAQKRAHKCSLELCVWLACSIDQSATLTKWLRLLMIFPDWGIDSILDVLFHMAEHVRRIIIHAYLSIGLTSLLWLLRLFVDVVELLAQVVVVLQPIYHSINSGWRAVHEIVILFSGCFGSHTTRLLQ